MSGTRILFGNTFSLLCWVVLQGFSSEPPKKIKHGLQAARKYCLSEVFHSLLLPRASTAGFVRPSKWKTQFRAQEKEKCFLCPDTGEQF